MMKSLALGVLMFVGFGGAASADDAVRTVFVPNNVIYPGDVISADALVERKVRVSSENPAVFGENPKDLIGKMARRTLLRNEYVPRSAVRDRDAVLQGRPYKVIYNSESLSIVGEGIAQKAGAVGDVIPVRNPASGVMFKARVQADQTLTVDEQ